MLMLGLLATFTVQWMGKQSRCAGVTRVCYGITPYVSLFFLLLERHSGVFRAHIHVRPYTEPDSRGPDMVIKSTKRGLGELSFCPRHTLWNYIPKTI